jgi:hypothetical protein
MALVIMRISMPDRLGMLAAAASAVSDANAEIVTIEVVHRSDGLVVDNLCIDIGLSTPSELRRSVEAVDGVVVELIRSVSAPPSPVGALELASSLAENADLRIQILVDGLPAALGAEWAMALMLQDDTVELIHASSGAPAPPDGTVPWMPLEAPRRLAFAPWMPTSWRLQSREVGEIEIAASPLGSPTTAVAIARSSGRFWPPELRQLEILAKLAVREPQPRTPPPVPSAAA